MVPVSVSLFAVIWQAALRRMFLMLKDRVDLVCITYTLTPLFWLGELRALLRDCKHR